jgi:carbonic anhydrase
MGSKDAIFNVHSIVEKDEAPGSQYLQSLLEGNKKWVAQRKEQDPEFFDKLAKPQTPKYLYFGCSDSRVPANQILGLG